MAGPLRIPARDRRRQIMQAATGLFARQGFQGTTTRQIAERARVNEALIFRHFPHKEDLYWAILADQCQSPGRRKELESKLSAGSDDSQVFAAIAVDILRRRMKDTSLTRLLFFSALENHGLAYRFFRTHVAQYYDVLARHIRKRVRAGLFRRVDPVLAARGFLGMVIYHILVQELFSAKRYQKFDLKHVGDTLSEIWLEGMRARRPVSRSPRNSGRSS